MFAFLLCFEVMVSEECFLLPVDPRQDNIDSAHTRRHGLNEATQLAPDDFYHKYGVDKPQGFEPTITGLLKPKGSQL